MEAFIGPAYLLLWFVALLATFPLGASAFYLNRDDPLWPSEEVWNSELGSQLSPSATLTLMFGPAATDPFALYATECEQALGSEPLDLGSLGNGLCMQAHYCQRQFCAGNNTPADHNLPAATVDVRTPDDITACLQFAALHKIAVSVKTTGHSYQGSSTFKDSLLIWMPHYPKDDTITNNYADSCGTNFDAVLGVGGGENFDDVLEAVKDDYHVVTGWCRTVSAAGGWLQGVGISHTLRTYGLGVDQVVDFSVVLANGTLVTADACTNPDLFWALRGGGGGTFGVVTHIHYKLHPATPICTLGWSFYGGGEWARREWIDFWARKSPTLDSRWSGVWNEAGLGLMFSGSYLQAFFSPFMWQLTLWYLMTFNPINSILHGVFSPPPVILPQFSWYRFRGGSDAHQNPDSTSPTGYEDWTYGARIIPQDVVETRREEVVDFLLNLMPSGYKLSSYYLGGVANDVPADATAVNPVMRRALWHVGAPTPEVYAKLVDFFPNDVSGSSFNHHFVEEIAWRESLWGPHYERLAELKQRYDPDNVFNCWHCVGYIGEEKEYTQS